MHALRDGATTDASWRLAFEVLVHPAPPSPSGYWFASAYRRLRALDMGAKVPKRALGQNPRKADVLSPPMRGRSAPGLPATSPGRATPRCHPPFTRAARGLRRVPVMARFAPSQPPSCLPTKRRTLPMWPDWSAPPAPLLRVAPHPLWREREDRAGAARARDGRGDAGHVQPPLAGLRRPHAGGCRRTARRDLSTG